MARRACAPRWLKQIRNSCGFDEQRCSRHEVLNRPFRAIELGIHPRRWPCGSAMTASRCMPTSLIPTVFHRQANASLPIWPFATSASRRNSETGRHLGRCRGPFLFIRESSCWPMSAAMLAERRASCSHHGRRREQGSGVADQTKEGDTLLKHTSWF